MVLSHCLALVSLCAFLLQCSRFIFANIRLHFRLVLQITAFALYLESLITCHFILFYRVAASPSIYSSILNLWSSVPWQTTKQVKQEARRSSNQMSNLSMTRRAVTNRGQQIRQKNVKYPVGGVVAATQNDAADRGSERGSVGEGRSVVGVKRAGVARREAAMAEATPRTTWTKQSVPSASATMTMSLRLLSCSPVATHFAWSVWLASTSRLWRSRSCHAPCAVSWQKSGTDETCHNWATTRMFSASCHLRCRRLSPFALSAARANWSSRTLL